MMNHHGRFPLLALLISVLTCLPSRADENDLVWSTFLGSYGHEAGHDIGVDGSGNVYITGITGSNEFPVTVGAYDREYGGQADAFVAKLNSAGSALEYATFLGGKEADEGYGIALDGFGNAYVTGYTRSSDFPTTVGAFDTTFGEDDDVFVTKLDATGSTLEYATFLGGVDNESGMAIAVNSGGQATVTGYTGSADFPITAGAFDETLGYYGDAFVARLNATGSALVYSTYLGGSTHLDRGTGIAVDSIGNAYVSGYTASVDFPVTAGAFDGTHNGESDAFAAKLDPTGSSLAYGTFLGGSGIENGPGRGPDIAVDRFGNAYITGGTSSADFPTNRITFDDTHNGAYDAFVAKLNAAGNTLAYCTFLGGSEADEGNAIAVDKKGNAYVTGYTKSPDFPATPGAFDTTLSGYPGRAEVFVAVFDPLGVDLLYATYISGYYRDEGFGIALQGPGDVCLTGWTFSSDFPTTPGALDRSFDGSQFHADAFVSKLGLATTPISPETEAAALPPTCALQPNFPNPFNDHTEIRYLLGHDGHVVLEIFNTLGQHVRTLVDSEQRAGDHSWSWDGRDDAGGHVASGLYVCRLRAGDVRKTIKMMCLR